MKCALLNISRARDENSSGEGFGFVFLPKALTSHWESAAHVPELGSRRLINPSLFGCNRVALRP